ncbi:MAG: contractile injection system protein, VgrG/Pvc8 family [Myxococcales bacterium]
MDGQKLGIDEDAALARVVVDLNADLFGECTLIFHDPKLTLINGQKFACGAAIKVEIGFAAKMQKVFEGEVVALEPQFRRDLPPALRVVCQESIHRLALSQMTRAFNDVDDSEIATKVAQEHGLTAEAPSGSKEHVLQANVTDAVFLRRLAQKHGNQLRMEGKKLIIGPPAKGADVAIAPGDGLTRLKVKIKSQQQVGEVTVHGWDPKTRQEIVGKAKPPSGVTGEGATQYGSGKTQSFAGHEGTPTDTATAEAMAKGRLRKIAEGFVVAQGQMIGDARVVPGAVLQLDKISAGVDGGYRVSEARHEFSKHGYYISFKAVRIAKKPPPKPAPPPPAPQQQPPQQAPQQAPQQPAQPSTPNATGGTGAGTGGSARTGSAGTGTGAATGSAGTAGTAAGTGGTASGATGGTAGAATGGTATGGTAAQQGAVTVEIKAANGTSPAPSVVGARGTTKLVAVPAGGADGTFAWTTSSGKIVLTNNAAKEVTVTAGAASSASLGAEVVELTFTPKAGGAPTKVSAKLSVITAEIAASSNQTYGYDDMSGVANAVPHVSVEQNQTTAVTVKVKGGPGGEALFFDVADKSTADVTPPAARGAATFDLTISGKAKNKASTKVQVKAVDASGPVLAEFEINVYKTRKLEANVFKVQDSRSAASSLIFPNFDIGAASTEVNRWYAQSVQQMKLNDANGAILDVAYDDNSNGYVEIEPGATSEKVRKIKAALTGGGQKVVICKRVAWVFFLKTAGAVDDLTVTLKDSYSGTMQYVLPDRNITLGAGATAETLKIKTVTGTRVTFYSKLTKAHPVTDGMVYELSGLSGNPLWVAETGKTEALVRQTIGHELGHSLSGWADLNEPTNLMYLQSADVHRLNLKPLTKTYGGGDEAQWDIVPR